MKKTFVLLALATGISCANAQVGVSIGIHQPGLFGRINIGDAPRPEVVYAQPVVIAPQQYVERRQPIYLYVPPEHQRNWGRYCGAYSACGQPVYFVREQWVRDRYEHDHPGWDRGRRGDGWAHRGGRGSRRRPPRGTYGASAR
jgi:hypothetical protein